MVLKTGKTKELNEQIDKLNTLVEKLTKEKLYYYRQVPPVPEPNNQEYNTGN